MEVIFLFGTVQGLFLSILIFTKKNKSTGDYVLGAWMAFLGLHLLDTYFHSTGLVFKYPHLMGLGINFPILQGPFLFVYVLVMINKTGRFKPVYLLHGMPFIILTIYFMFDFYFLDASGKLEYYHRQFSVGMSPAIKFGSFLCVYLGPVYVIWSLIKLRKHSKNITEQFSYTEQINLNWLKYVVAGLGFVWITVLVTKMPVFSHLVPFDLGNQMIYLSVTAAVFFLGFFGLKQKAIYVEGYDSAEKPEVNVVQSDEKPQERYKKSGLNEKKAKEYLRMLLKYMDDEKPYLNGKLNIRDVACHLGVSINHLSQVINGQLGVSFFDLINKYRVDEVISRLSKSENEQYTLLAIAYNCGFCSKSSFNNIFKKITGYTPSRYTKEKISYTSV